ncbi:MULTISPECIES: toll/interleukin-1 receptor domain-containing protein [Gluconobacter]|uniref:Toll/interleukin-1 receptor domain-containing protein n=1 Tax=Gluconobacter cadivus TaxID=2728101 RepID=A0ABR9YYY7_9PROT|nr:MULTISPECIES: toll/interleukin-1 receptor domain-containing protein [Gluconobacter]MBF0889767.1 toll/interleukin-1 receptor domain-containing protein [Gluconobacter cadivus]MBS1061386.1 toll/interleukin-1 receptor domain-containing protein [Gluconobacter sp. Dm-44]
MTIKKIFLSHIHEEKEMALLIKKHVEESFAGFVDVFVSSDTESIMAGSNFLKVMEKGLIDCVAALYLISPKSVSRSWINFELGAVWTRNLLSQKDSGPEIPTIPICHSGITPSQLPQPINNLDAINAVDVNGWTKVFRSLQIAAGSRGILKNDLSKLVSEINEIQNSYTMNRDIIRALEIIGCINPNYTKQQLANSLDKEVKPKLNGVKLICLGEKNVRNELEVELLELSKSSLKDTIILEKFAVSQFFSPQGAISGTDYKVSFSVPHLFSALGI